MSRTCKNKQLTNTRLAANYGGWIYCTNCQKNIGYLCYSTYDRIDFRYECNCGSKGSIFIDFEDSQAGHACDKKLKTIKNRYCCDEDESPLITILDKHVAHYDLEITCKQCLKTYRKNDVQDQS